MHFIWCYGNQFNQLVNQLYFPLINLSWLLWIIFIISHTIIFLLKWLWIFGVLVYKCDWSVIITICIHGLGLTKLWKEGVRMHRFLIYNSQLWDCYILQVWSLCLFIVQVFLMWIFCKTFVCRGLWAIMFFYFVLVSLTIVKILTLCKNPLCLCLWQLSEFWLCAKKVLSCLLWCFVYWGISFWINGF